MENQHRKITGYRELSQEEIDLMNEIKAKGDDIGKLVNKLEARLGSEIHNLKATEPTMPLDTDAETADLYVANMQTWIAANYSYAEGHRWKNIAKDHLQQGIMALVRAVARPSSF